MKRDFKRIMFLGLAVAGLTVARDAGATATLYWGTTTQNNAFQDAGFTQLIDGGTPGVVGSGGFVQLLYLGTDGVLGGVGGAADLVAQTAYVGNLVMNPGADGQFSGTYQHNYAPGANFVIQFFELPSPNYAGGVAPAGEYGFSQIFTTQADPGVNGVDSFSFNADYAATVPEPGTVALVFLGLGLVGLRRLRK